VIKNTATTRPKTLEELIDPSLATRLTGLDITARKVLSGKMKGERRSKRRGESVEFADHRQYAIGDDLRHVDWNIFGRLDRLFLKLFLEEEDLSLHVVVDASASSDCGTPDKFVFMQKACAAMGLIGLANLHRVQVTAMGGLSPTAEPQLMSTVRDLRGRRRMVDLSRFVCQVEPGGSVDFAEVCRRIYLSRRGKGVLIVMSDFFFKKGYEEGLRTLAGMGYELHLLQVLSPQELKPELGGDLRLKDAEDGDVTEVTISASLLKRYQANLSAYCERLKSFAVSRGMVCETVSSGTPIDQLVLEYLRRSGVVQ
jgi:uncharacterized protein (DUF58 family)